MADYTMMLRSYIESFSQYEEGLSWEERIEIGRKNLFDFDYPIFDENYRKTFETNFIRTFYMREIGFETEGLFKFQLQTFLRVHMPYYNKFFESELLEYDPLSNTEMFLAHRREGEILRKDDRNITQDSNTTGNSNSELEQETKKQQTTKDDGFSRVVNSDNPDGRLRLQTEDGKGVIEYANEITETKADNEKDLTGTDSVESLGKENTEMESHTENIELYSRDTNEIEDFLQRRFGKIGTESYASLVNSYRSSIINTEKQIFKDCQSLFMLIY